MADRIECYFGPSGAGKSRALAEIIVAHYNETGKTSRVLIGDGSAATYEDMGLVDAGVVKLMDYTIRDWPISTMQQLCEGYWPADAQDPKSPMVAPKAEDMKSLAVTGIEGISMVGNYIMGDKKGGLAERSSRGEKIGQDSPIMLTDADFDARGQMVKGSGPGLTFGGNPIAHYNVAQKRIAGFIERSKMLPGWVIWTAHEKAAESKLTNEVVIGPEAAGGAMTSNLSRVFNNTLHFTTAEAKAKVKDEHTGVSIDDLDAEYRIYFRDHFRPEGKLFVKFRAVTRIAYPDMLPKNGYLTGEPGKAILEFYSIVKASRERAKREMLKPKAEVAA